MIDHHLRMLKVDMDHFQTELRETGEYDFLGARKVSLPPPPPLLDSSTSFKPPSAHPPTHLPTQQGDAVAFKQSVYETHFVLGRVVSYRSDSGAYEVVDVDDDSRVYTLPETQVRTTLPPTYLE